MNLSAKIVLAFFLYFIGSLLFMYFICRNRYKIKNLHDKYDFKTFFRLSTDYSKLQLKTFRLEMDKDEFSDDPDISAMRSSYRLVLLILILIAIIFILAEW